MTAQQQVVPTSADIRCRLPMPRELAAKDDIDARKWRVLCETTFPNARTSEAVLMALDYCRARGLDVFKRPVHIVPMWNSTLKREVETVWAGINEIQTTAARTGAWAGMDEPKWGPSIDRTFKGRKKSKDGWSDAEATVSFPEWCAVTVYRMISGQRCAFTEPVFWLEAYSRGGGSELPTDMWVKRPRGQLHKVGKAASLRAAFPEEGEYTAEEMEGNTIEAGGIVIQHEPANGNAKPTRTMAEISANKKRREDECAGVQKDLSQIETLSELERYQAEHLTTAFMGSLGNAQWAVEEWLEARRAELSAPAEDDSADETELNKAEYIRHCHVVIEEAKDEKSLLGWWNSNEQKTSRRQHELTPEEVQDLKARLFEKRERILKALGDAVMEAGG